MRIDYQNTTLTIYFEGEVNSYNSEDVEKEIEATLKGKNIETIKIDMEKLNYISSAGLRIIVRLKQKYNDTSLIKVPNEVFDILDMVGFQNIISIERL